MWNLLTNMVSTRRSSRLQEKQGASSAPTSPTPSAQASLPTTRRRQSLGATKATSPSTKASPDTRGRGRGRGRKTTAAENGSEDGSATQSDAVSDQHTEASISAGEGKDAHVNKQLFVDETEASETAAAAPATELSEEVIGEKQEDPDHEAEPEAASESAEIAVAVESEKEEAETNAEETEEAEEKVEQKEEETEDEADAALIVEVEEKPEEEEEEVEEEIVMMDTSEGEEEDEQEQDPAEEEEDDDDDEDIDVEAFAKIAASGLLFSTTQTKPSNSSSVPIKTGRVLVPDTLDSGASSRTKFLEFEGTKLGLGAKVVAATASAEEQKVLAQQLGRVAKSNRQRSEALQTASAGRKWFDMSTHEMDADARRDFALLKMRNYLDPKKFYKTSDHTKKMPKHFQMGTVIEGAHEFKSARLTKKERKQTFTDEIMADESVRKYTKRVFLQVQSARAGGKNSKHKKQKRF